MPQSAPPGYHIYQAFNGLSLYFRGKFDYFKYNGKSSFSKPDKYASHPQRFQYACVERSCEEKPMAFLYSVFAYNDFEYMTPKRFFTMPRNAQVKAQYQHLCDEGYTKDLIKDLQCIKKNETMHDTSSLFPLVHQLVHDGDITLETAILYDTIVKPVYVKDASPDPIRWPSTVNKIDLIRPLLMRAVHPDLVRDAVATVFPAN